MYELKLILYRWFEMSIVTSVIPFVYSHVKNRAQCFLFSVKICSCLEQSTMFFFFILSVKICSCLNVTIVRVSAGK